MLESFLVRAFAFLIMPSEHIAYSLLEFPHYLFYSLVVLLMIFLGEETLLIIGAFSRLGYFDFWAVALAALIGTFIGDFFWFKVGAKYGERFIVKYGHWFLITPRRFEVLEKKVKRGGGLFIFFSKFIYNLNHISLVAAGAVKFNFKKFIRIQIFVSIVWVLFFTSLGYFFAHNLAGIKHNVKLFAVLMSVIFVVFILADELLGRILARKVTSGNGNGNGEEDHS